TPATSAVASAAGSAAATSAAAGTSAAASEWSGPVGEGRTENRSPVRGGAPRTRRAPAFRHGVPARRARSGGGAAGPRRRDQALRIAEMSKFSLILSETRKPPVSSAAFQDRPQSERRISALPSKPTRWLPNGSVAAPL